MFFVCYFCILSPCSLIISVNLFVNVQCMYMYTARNGKGFSMTCNNYPNFICTSVHLYINNPILHSTKNWRLIYLLINTNNTDLQHKRVQVSQDISPDTLEKSLKIFSFVLFIFNPPPPLSPCRGSVHRDKKTQRKVALTFVMAGGGGGLRLVPKETTAKKGWVSSKTIFPLGAVQL